MQKAFGTTDPVFVEGLMRQLIGIGSPGELPDTEGTGFAVSFVKALRPRNAAEAALAAQMVAVHNAGMREARLLLTNAPGSELSNNALRGLNACARSYAKLHEAFHKGRTGGKQRVTVKHVTVKQGGQAIVGNVSTGKGGVTQTRCVPRTVKNRDSSRDRR